MLTVFAPAVFCVEDEYQIVFMTDAPGMAWAEVAGAEYADAAAGLMRWQDTVHRVTLPRAALDEARAYTICYQKMDHRAPYRPEHGDTLRETFAFCPVEAGKPLRIFYLADTHGRFDEPAACAAAREFDLLIVGGDVANHNSEKKDLHLLLKQIGAITGGTRPAIFSRGNHDTRGPMAWYLPEIMGTNGGDTFFTVRLPGVFMIVLDAGEDKADANVEYGGTVRFEAYRRRETAWLESVVRDEKWRGAPLRLAVCHIPFTLGNEPPFDIEAETYARWTECLNDMGVSLLLAGHLHETGVIAPGDARLTAPAAFPTVIGSALNKSAPIFIGAHLTFERGACTARMIGEDQQIIEEIRIPLE